MRVNFADILNPSENWHNGTDKNSRVICWWSGGIASAYASILAMREYDNCELHFCDTGIEHPDTYRFMVDFERVTGHKVHIHKSDRFEEPEAVWLRYLGLNFAHGAPCSMVMKKEVRVKKIQNLKTDYAQIFGFDFCKKEIKRATNMVKNYPELNCKFPLLEQEVTREQIFIELNRMGLKPPSIYENFANNNCIASDASPKGGCVQGGIGYWQQMREVYPKKFDRMAMMEHLISHLKGAVVTICKDQREKTRGQRLFLKPNPRMPEVGTIDLIKGRRPQTMRECNGFCDTVDMFA